MRKVIIPRIRDRSHLFGKQRSAKGKKQPVVIDDGPDFHPIGAPLAACRLGAASDMAGPAPGRLFP